MAIIEKKLPQRPFATNDVSFSALSLGTVKFGRNQAVKYPQAFDFPNDTEISDLLHIAFEHGLTTLDTAPAYGIAQQRLGKVLKNRQQWQIISKAGEFFDHQTSQSHYDFSAKALRASLENTLRELKTDYLDAWLLHSDGNDLANLNDEVIKTLLDAKQQGLVRSVGASTKTVAGGEYALRYLDGIMMSSSLENSEENALFAIAEQQQKGLILKKIYNSGWILNNADKQQRMQETLAFLFAQSAVSTAVIGTINPKHLLENIDAWHNR